jgi:DNA (cytosine-5)-methyltransferase 1
MPLTVGSLFSGIGGFELGFERTGGFQVRWQVEIDDYCTRVLEQHWPNVRRYRDIRDCGAHNLEPVDVICGGFPCQDISSNNQHKRGLSGAKSGLFYQAIRVVGELRPRYVLLENVADLLVRGMGDVLGELAAIGYDAEWECLPAAAFGLPQPRWRVFVVAYPGGGGCQVGDEWIASGAFARARIDGDGLAAAEHRAAEAAERVRGMDDGLPGTVDRVAVLGNSIVPQIAEWIGRRILEAEAQSVVETRCP